MNEKRITLIGGDGLGEHEISVGVIDCDKCERKNILGVCFEYSWLEWSLCFECLEETKKKLEKN